MSSASALTGRLGVFTVDGTRVARCTEWNVDPALAHNSEWGDSDSAGYTNRMAGRKDCKFSANGKFDTTSPQYDLFDPGDIVAVVLWMNTTLRWTFPRAECIGFKLAVNIDTEDVVGWTSEWGPDGIYYRPGQSGAPAATYPT